ncbi:MAG: ABC transporter substrate-binding protein [bacterium]
MRCRHFYILIFLAFLAFFVSYVFKTQFEKQSYSEEISLFTSTLSNRDIKDQKRGQYSRIISLAPSITEVLFALDLGDRVAGVTNFCDYPPEARSKEKVGGYYDTSYETILSLKPDLVIMLHEHETQKNYLERLGLPILVVDQRDTQDIMKSVITIGKVCDKETLALEIVSDIKTRMDRIKDKTMGLPRPKVLICVGRTIGSEALEDIFITGGKGFYNEIITLAGGINAYEGHEIRYPTLTGEGITRLDPDVIIEIIPDLSDRGLDEGKIKKEWETLPGVDAVKNKRIYIFGQDYVATPGPRFILILEQMARAIHPEINWE